jgi:hypothetical protein
MVTPPKLGNVVVAPSASCWPNGAAKIDRFWQRNQNLSKKSRELVNRLGVQPTVEVSFARTKNKNREP